VNIVKINPTKWLCSQSDLENKSNNDQRKLPTLEVCSKILKEYGFSCITLGGEKREGGNGDIHFTTDGKYAVKRSCDAYAQHPQCNEIKVMYDVIDKINSSNPQGFDVNLPTALIQIVDKETNENAFCNVQISQRVQTKYEQGFHDMGDVVRSIVNQNKDEMFPLVFTLGEDLAKFHQSQGILESAKGFGLGLQHGDFNHGNILINKNGEHTFTLIDNADFRPKATVICDLVYFVYFNSIVFSKDITPNQANKVNRIIQVIERLYEGYIKCADESNLITMAKYFANGNPVLASTVGDYNREFLNTDLWSNTFEKAQQEVFKKACFDRYPNPPKAIFVNSIVTIEDIIGNYEWSSNGRFLDLTSFKSLKHIDGLKDLPQMERLNLAFTQVEDVSPAAALSNLQYLNASYSNVLEDVSPLSKLSQLISLKLSGTPVAAVKPLAALALLTELDLSQTPVVWVGALSPLTGLKKLNLSYSGVNDAQSDLTELSTLKNLEILDLRGTSVRKVDNLFPHLPKVNIAAKCNVGFGYTLGVACEPFWGDKTYPLDIEPNTTHSWKGMVPKDKKWKFVKTRANQCLWEDHANRSVKVNTDVNKISF
jgi:hypothetical protein